MGYAGAPSKIGETETQLELVVVDVELEESALP